jgi:hypothetical protein
MRYQHTDGKLMPSLTRTTDECAKPLSNPAVNENGGAVDRRKVGLAKGERTADQTQKLFVELAAAGLDKT